MSVQKGHEAIEKNVKSVNRIEALDIAKAVCILAVIWWHFLYCGMFELGLFNVPLFFVISGFFLSTKKPLGVFVDQKRRQLVNSYIITAIFVVLACFIKRMVESRSWEVAKPFVLESIVAQLYGSGSPYENSVYNILACGPTWYLLALFFGMVIVRVAVSTRFSPLIVIASVVIGYIISGFIWLPWGILAGMVDAGYIYLGYLLKLLFKHWQQKKDQLDAGKRRALSFAEAVTELCLFVLSILYVIYYKSLNDGGLLLLSANDFPDGFYTLVGSFAAMTAVYLLCSRVLVYIPLLKNILIFIGQNTLLILCVHTVDTLNFSWRFVLDAFPDNMLQAIIICYVCKILLYIAIVFAWKAVCGLIKDKLWKQEKNVSI